MGKLHQHNKDSQTIKYFLTKEKLYTYGKIPQALKRFIVMEM